MQGKTEDKIYLFHISSEKAYNKQQNKDIQMKRIEIFLIFAVLSFVFLSSCVVTLVDMREDSAYLPAGNFHETYPFTEGGVISISNRRGDIEITGWEKSGVDVYAEKMFLVPKTAMVQVFRKGLIPDIDIDRFEDYIGIKTESDPEQKTTGMVSYSLKVPYAINLDRIRVEEGDVIVSSVYGKTYIELEKGNVTVENYSGTLTVNVQDGLVDIGLVDVRNEDSIAVSVDRGEIMLHLEEGAQVDIEASVLTGTIMNEFEADTPSAENKVSFQLGQGGAVLSLTVSTGDITIKKGSL